MIQNAGALSVLQIEDNESQIAETKVNSMLGNPSSKE